MTARETLAEGTRRLELPSVSSSVDTPALDAALLLAEILRLDRSRLMARLDEDVCENDRENYFNLVRRRLDGECVAYILGRREFRGLDFAVNRHVLVPRPDTETLVEAALEYIDGKYHHLRCANGGGRKISLLDLCTGSGAVAISLKKERPFLNVTASDISPNALEIAEENATLLLAGSCPEVAEKTETAVVFVQSDLFQDIPERYDIIVSNPPYVPSFVMANLAPEVLWEPHLALDGGRDGLEIIRRIISGAEDHLVSGGVLLLETACDQMPVIRSLLESEGYDDIKTQRDLAGKERVISGKLSKSRTSTEINFQSIS